MNSQINGSNIPKEYRPQVAFSSSNARAYTAYCSRAKLRAILYSYPCRIWSIYLIFVFVFIIYLFIWRNSKLRWLVKLTDNSPKQYQPQGAFSSSNARAYKAYCSRAKSRNARKDTRDGLGHGVIIFHAHQERSVNAQVEGDATW